MQQPPHCIRSALQGTLKPFLQRRAARPVGVASEELKLIEGIRWLEDPSFGLVSTIILGSNHTEIPICTSSSKVDHLLQHTTATTTKAPTRIHLSHAAFRYSLLRLLGHPLGRPPQLPRRRMPEEARVCAVRRPQILLQVLLQPHLLQDTIHLRGVPLPEPKERIRPLLRRTPEVRRARMPREGRVPRCRRGRVHPVVL